MLAELQAQGILDDTLVVLTADHGAIASTNFQGKTAAGSGTSDTNWYYGPDSLPTVYNNPSPSLQPLLATGNVQFSYQSTSIQTWLKDTSPAKVAESTTAMFLTTDVMPTILRVLGIPQTYPTDGRAQQLG